MEKLETNALSMLLFHSLDNQASPISFSPQLFREVLKELYNCGYRTLSLAEVSKSLYQQTSFSPTDFVITFDDGYQSVYKEAFPVLQEFGFSATVFITVGEKRPTNLSTQLPIMEARPMLSWQQIQEMHRWGITIGSHTLTHRDLTNLSLAQKEVEIVQSQKIIEDLLSSPVNYFAYPYGYYDQLSYKLVQQHYQGACSAQLGQVTLSSDLYTLERVETAYFRTKRLGSLMLSPLFPWYLQARRLPRAFGQLLRRRRV